MSRISKDEMFLQICDVLSKRATCLRRGVGCVIVDKNGYILSTGYNGVPGRLPHCSELGCFVNCAPGESIDSCNAVHAEQNAIARLDKYEDANMLYCSTEPCVSCLKLILVTNIKRVVFSNKYVTNSELIKLSKIEWVHHASNI